jgi:hypothetical protein
MIAAEVDRIRSGHAASSELSDRGGGHMDDVLRRLGLVESAVAELRGAVQHLATKADVNALETRLVKAIADGDAKLAATIAALDTRLSASIASLEGRLIKWLVGTVLASVGTAAAVAKFMV